MTENELKRHKRTLLIIVCIGLALLCFAVIPLFRH
jgi:hypothetical protein